MATAIECARIAERFAQARLSATSLAEFPGVVPRDLRTAYECQAAALAHWPDDAVVGWKVARVAPEWRAQFPEERLIGPILRQNLHANIAGRSQECPVFDGGFAAIEAEIGVVVAADAPAGKLNWSTAEAADFIAQMCVGVEIASSPLASINDLGPGCIASDFGNNWGAIIGAPLPNWSAQAEALVVSTSIESKLVGQAPIAIPQTPLEAFAFSLGQAAQLGRPLRTGQYISTGMITGVHPVRIGESARVQFGGQGSRGEILCHFVAAQPAQDVRSRV